MGDWMTKRCLSCSAVLERFDNESEEAFERREFCSIPCSLKKQMEPMRIPITNEPVESEFRLVAGTYPEEDKKECAFCNKTFTRKTGESPGQFEARLCCDRKCAMAYLKAHPERRVRSFLTNGLHRSKELAKEIHESIEKRHKELEGCKLLFAGMRRRMRAAKAKAYREEIMRTNPDRIKKWRSTYTKEGAERVRMRHVAAEADCLSKRYLNIKLLLINKELATDKNVWGALIAVAGTNCGSFRRRDIAQELCVMPRVFCDTYKRMLDSGFIYLSGRNKLKLKFTDAEIRMLANNDLTPLKRVCELAGDVWWLK